MKIYKIAKIAEAPPAMLERIYSEVVKFNESGSNKFHYVRIPVDLEGWGYGGNELITQIKDQVEAQSREDYEMYSSLPDKNRAFFLGVDEADLDAMDIDTYANKRVEREGEINLNLFPNLNIDAFNAPTRSQPANYAPAMKTLAIYTKSNPDLLKRFIRHELIHVVQNLYKEINGNKGFMPKNKSLDKNDPYTQPDSFDDYLLMDEEFHTWLHDTSKDLLEELDNVPDKADRQRVLSDFIQEKRFLNVLKARNYEKYKEAISELYKLI